MSRQARLDRVGTFGVKPELKLPVLKLNSEPRTVTPSVSS
jgi:hypothetical protein